MSKQDFKALLEKYLEGQATAEELKKLVNYYESFQQKNTWTEALGDEEVTKQSVFDNILKELQDSDKQDKKVIPLYKRPVFKYVAAAALILLSISFFFKNKVSQVATQQVAEIKSPDVETGTDKAVLTLEDGSLIALQKGESFQGKNTNSNGEEIIYKNGELEKESIQYNYLTIPRGGQFSIQLSDGTQIWLNSASQLKYPVKFIKGESRQVELVYGEAYFDVSPSSEHGGSKFTVLSDTQKVEVIGTEFNIKAYGDESTVSTTLVKGKVAVNLGSDNKFLKPGQQLYHDKITQASLIKEVDVYNETSWKEGVFTFDDKSLKEMMKVVSRWYDVDVIIENKAIEDKGFVGVLRKNQELEEILISIKNFKIIKDYEILNGKIILH